MDEVLPMRFGGYALGRDPFFGAPKSLVELLVILYVAMERHHFSLR